MDEGIDPKKFEQVREEAESLYHSLGKVSCPYFKATVAFNALGLEHIKFKDIRQSRPHSDQYIRFRLIKFAPMIIQATHTLQGISIRKNFERERSSGRWQSTMRNVTYYEFVAVVKEVRVRVIVKQVESGPYYFWSIIPFWKMDKNR